MTCHSQLELCFKNLTVVVAVAVAVVVVVGIPHSSRPWLAIASKNDENSKNIDNKMGCFNDPAWKVCGWWGGGVADTNYLYPARWGWINSSLGLDQYIVQVHPTL